MKIYEITKIILSEADDSEQEKSQPLNKPTSRLARAASLDDQPRDTEDSEDLDNDSSQTDADTAAIDRFKEVGGDLGADLYSMTPWRYPEIFEWNAGDKTELRNIIQAVADLSSENQSVYQEFQTTKESDVERYREIRFVILDARTNTLIDFYAGADVAGRENLDADQQQVISRIVKAGKKYTEALERDPEWEFGGSANARLDSATDNLLDVLDSYRTKMYDFRTPEQRAEDEAKEKTDYEKNKARRLRREEENRRRKLLKKQKKEQELAGLGREKR